MRQFIIASGLLAIFSAHATSNPVIAHGQSSASFSYQLTDLDLSDQIAPDLRIIGSMSSVQIGKSMGYGYESKSTDLGNTSLFDASSTSLALKSGSVSIGKLGNTLEEHLSIDAATFLNLPYREHGGFPANVAGAYVTLGTGFQLSAHTQITISGLIQVNMSMDTSPLASFDSISNGVKFDVQTSQTFSASISDDDPLTVSPFFQIIQDGRQFVASSGVVYSQNPSSTIHQQFDLVYRNDTDADVLLNFNTSSSMGATWSWSDSPIPAIPEPETWALMLAGLGVVSWRARSGWARS